jgi:hypothetical protein
MNKLIEKNKVLKEQQKEAMQIIQERQLIERILRNNFTAFLARTNEGKTMTLCHLISLYKKYYSGDVVAFGMDGELTKKLGVRAIYSLIELEQVKSSIVILDELGILFDLTDRKKRGMIDTFFRKLDHNGNKCIGTGLPSDFKKFLCAKAKCFIFKGLNVNDLINGSLAKSILTQYKGAELGVFSFDIAKDKSLCYDGNFFELDFPYNPEWDTKSKNVDLFVQKKCA